MLYLLTYFSVTPAQNYKPVKPLSEAAMYSQRALEIDRYEVQIRRRCCNVYYFENNFSKEQSNIIIIFLVLNFSPVFAQLEFCQGSKGDPIFHENFGTGNLNGPPLPANTTSYIYAPGNPGDGEYTISDRLNEAVGNWHAYLPATTISNDRALFVNASFSSGRFYRKQISSLCENTTYEFSAFLINVYNRSLGVCPNRGIPVNVKFEIWDETDSEMLNRGKYR